MGMLVITVVAVHFMGAKQVPQELLVRPLQQAQKFLIFILKPLVLLLFMEILLQ